MLIENGVIVLDREGDAGLTDIVSEQDIAQIESVPIRDRLTAHSTYEALRLGAAINPAADAIQFLPNADPSETPLLVSHQQFIANVTRAANLFTEHGIEREGVVSILLPLLPQNFYALFGAEAAGIANPVNPLLAPHQLVEILRAAGTRVLVACGPLPGTDIWQKVEQIRDQLPQLEVVFQVGGELQPGAIDFDRGLENCSSEKLQHGRDLKADDTAAYFHTGGTTGTPKLVRHSHLNQVYQAWLLNRVTPAPAGDTLLFGLPLFHVGGALTQGLTALTRGGSLVILSAAGWRHPNAVRNVWKLVERFKPSSLGAVPTVLAAAVGVPVGDSDISSLTCSSGGGSAIPVAVGKVLQQVLDRPVLEVYGMTETSSVHTLAYPDRELRLGSAGHAVPYSRVQTVVLDAKGDFVRDCEVDEIGVIAMSGPGVFSGYLNKTHNAGAFVKPGWVNSGDLGRLDTDGYLWITGRAKDLIIRGGHNIDPAGVEDILFGHEQVALVAMVGQPDVYAGELPLAFVQCVPNADVKAATLVELVRQNTPERAAVPVDIVFMEALPLTGVGKVFKPALRWIAAQRVFEERLASVNLPAGASIAVSVGAHGTHGSLAKVTLNGVEDVHVQGTLGEQVAQKLAPFVLAHQVLFT